MYIDGINIFAKMKKSRSPYGKYENIEPRRTMNFGIKMCHADTKKGKKETTEGA